MKHKNDFFSYLIVSQRPFGWSGVGGWISVPPTIVAESVIGVESSQSSERISEGIQNCQTRYKELSRDIF